MAPTYSVANEMGMGSGQQERSGEGLVVTVGERRVSTAVLYYCCRRIPKSRVCTFGEVRGVRWCVLVNSVRLLSHKSQDRVCRVAREGAGEVSEFKSEAVKVEVQLGFATFTCKISEHQHVLEFTVQTARLNSLQLFRQVYAVA